MAYQSLYRRYRPQRFADVSGQEHLVKALRNAVAEDRVGHAYLFSGPRGTGKTTNARILAKVLNCTNPQDGEPCCECESCVAIQAGTSFDLHELDAASHNGVGDIRDLIEKAALGTPGRTKVYILDEVHMLSTAASNALLKTLEEPPEHVVFVLATTDPQKVLPTIRSRTQHFEVHLLSADELADLVRKVAADAGLDVTDEQVDYVVRKGAGSARDTLSALDQVVAAGGVPQGGESLDDLVAALVARDAGAVLAAVQAGVSAGREPRVIGELLLARLRDAFLAAMDADLGHLSDADRHAAVESGRAFGPRALTTALEALGDALIEMRQAPDPRIPLEVALIRVARPDTDGSLEALAVRVEQLERSLSTGAAPVVVPASPTSTPAPTPSPAPEPSGPPPAPVASSPTPDGGTDAGRPADRARQALADRAASPRPVAARPEPAAAPPPAPEPAATSRRATAPKAALGAHRKGRAPAATDDAPEAAPSTSGASSDALPTRDELTLAWGDDVLDALPGKAKAFFKAGRFVEVSGGHADFALPSKIHAERCEPHRPAVEQALAAHFGRPVPLRLVVDRDTPRPPGPGDEPPAPEPDPIEEVGPIDELRDANDHDETHLERITAAFPGAEIVAPDPD
jgi:DNA polymerase-3 subunit gamma/tau